MKNFLVLLLIVALISIFFMPSKNKNITNTSTQNLISTNIPTAIPSNIPTKTLQQKEEIKKQEDELRREIENSNIPINYDYKKFDDTFKNKTNIQKEEFWKKAKNKYVQWEGTVTDVRDDYIGIRVRNQTLAYDYLAYINTNQKDMLLNINKKDYLIIKGRLDSTPGIILPWILKDCEIIIK